jgi:VIT1/CCC1 family predicted Fe2+/Mn2+ transporter
VTCECSPDNSRRTWARPAVLGASDGMMSILGVVFYLGDHAGLILPAAAIGGLSAALSMAAGEWLSDSAHGLGASLVMGAATGVGSIVPAFPYAVLRGGAAFALSAVLRATLTVAVGLLRTTPARRGARIAVTIGVLAVVYGVTLACALAMRGSST